MPSQWADLTSSWSPFSSNATIVCGMRTHPFLVGLSLMINAQVLCLVVSGGVSNVTSSVLLYSRRDCPPIKEPESMGHHSLLHISLIYRDFTVAVYDS